MKRTAIAVNEDAEVKVEGKKGRRKNKSKKGKKEASADKVDHYSAAGSEKSDPKPRPPQVQAAAEKVEPMPPKPQAEKDKLQPMVESAQYIPVVLQRPTVEIVVPKVVPPAQPKPEKRRGPIHVLIAFSIQMDKQKLGHKVTFSQLYF